MSEKVSSSSTSSVSGLQGRETLRGYFQTGETPTQSNFTDLIDSVVNQKDDQVTIDDAKKTITLGSNTTASGETPWQTVVQSAANAITLDKSTDSSTPQVDTTQLALVLQKGSDTDQEGIGLGFQSSTNTNVGAALVYQRTTTNSVGKLYFATKSSTEDTGAIPIQMTITDQGLVGIGTTSPQSLLDVAGDANVSSTLTIGGTSLDDTAINATNNSDNDATLSVKNSGSNDAIYATCGQGHGLHAINKSTTDSTLCSENQGDNVAIQATNTSSSSPTLSVENNGSGPSAYFSGNVGIGTTSPQNALDVNGGMVIGNSYAGTDTAPSNGLLVEGQVGIGTTSPQSLLDVAGDANVSSTLTIGGTSLDDNAIKATNKSDDDITLSVENSGSNDAIYATCSQGHALHAINNSTSHSTLYSENQGDNVAIQATNTSSSSPTLSVENNGSGPSAYFSGNVGIGTTSPQNALDVNGGMVIGSGYAGNDSAPGNGLAVAGSVGIGTNSPGGLLGLGNNGAYMTVSGDELIFYDLNVGEQTLAQLATQPDLSPYATISQLATWIAYLVVPPPTGTTQFQYVQMLNTSKNTAGLGLTTLNANSSACYVILNTTQGYITINQPFTSINLNFQCYPAMGCGSRGVQETGIIHGSSPSTAVDFSMPDYASNAFFVMVVQNNTSSGAGIEIGFSNEK